MRRFMVLAMIGGALFVGAPAQADAGCPFSVTVEHSRRGSGVVTGTIYEAFEQVAIVRGSKRLRVEFVSGTDVLYHQGVRAIPRKTTMRVHLGDAGDASQLDIEVVARRAGAPPQARIYDYICVP